MSTAVPRGFRMPSPSRRTVLAAALGLAVPSLGACDATPDAALPPEPPAIDADPPTPSATAAAAPTRPAAPSAAEMQARFGADVPREWGLEVTGTVLRTGTPGTALTFDACGGPQGAGIDSQLIAALRSAKVPATLFLNTRWVAANRALAHELAADPLFAIGNHGSRHLPLSVKGRAAYGIPGTANIAEVVEEVRTSRDALEQELQRDIPWFRAGTAHMDDVAVRICRSLGNIPVNFSVNADAGATFTAVQVATQLAGLKAGDIAIGHMNRPGSGTAAGFGKSLPALVARGLRFETLAALKTA
ncbi:polysaccharide deacetylase family protein [Sinomonas flava]|uniref:Polysaccharide deacetylase family protein n=1 Tax=Sinomonas flava TaxID=496857 RepID=A0ABP5NUB4_9MICC